MRIGLGVTSWSRGIESGQMDGLAHYSQELYRHLAVEKPLPVVFGNGGSDKVGARSVVRLPEYGISAAWSGVSGCAFPRERTLTGSIDLFHATDHFTPKFSNTPVVSTLMDAIPLSHPQWASQRGRALKNWLWKKSGHWADHVITISDFSKLEISLLFGIPNEKISVTSLGVDARYFNAIDTLQAETIARKMALPERFFLFIGTFQPRKNIERIVDAHEAMPTKIRKDVPLLIVGRSGWGSEELVARLNAYGDDGDVRWLRHVDDLTKRLLLQRSTALVFPSLAEGFGLPVLEGFASGTPVITSNTTSLPEVAGDAAWLVDPENTSEITEAMLNLATNEGARQSFIAKGLKRAHVFTWDACAQNTAAVYARVLAGH